MLRTPPLVYESALLGFVLAGVLRQALWGVAGFWPWIPAAIAGVWVAVLALRPLSGYRAPRWQAWLWLAAAVVFLLRLPVPDHAYDVLNYHLINGERAAFGPPLMAGEVPYPIQLDPLADMLMAVSRHLLGYRLGTILNLLFFIWTLRAVDLLLVKASTPARVLAGVATLGTADLVAQLSTYMVDGLSIAIMLTALAMLLEGLRDWRLGLLLGASIALKVPNIIFVAPLALLARSPGLLAGIMPLLPDYVWKWVHLGNPVFPQLNALFRSPYFAATNFRDSRWGPHGILETLAWPVVAPFTQRLSELQPAWLLPAVGFVIAVPLVRRRRVAFVIVCAAILWSIGSGYGRYAIVLGPLAAVLLAEFRWAWVALAAAAAWGIFTGVRDDWSSRPIDPQGARFILRDRRLDAPPLPDGSWIVTGPVTTGFMALLDPRRPILDLHDATGPKSAELIAQASGRFVSVILPGRFGMSVEASRQELERAGFTLSSAREFPLPFFSPDYIVPLVLLEVRK
jgi:hypothetical protein